MFDDDLDGFEADAEKALEAYTLEEILLDNDLTIARALALLMLNGHIILPDEQPL